MEEGIDQDLSGNNSVFDTTEPRNVNIPITRHTIESPISFEVSNFRRAPRSMDNSSDNDSINSEREALIRQRNIENGRKTYSETPLPKLPIFVLSVIIFSEPLNFSFLLPFVYFMVCRIMIVSSS